VKVAVIFLKQYVRISLIILFSLALSEKKEKIDSYYVGHLVCLVLEKWDILGIH
jgi:hypothetical protein